MEVPYSTGSTEGHKETQEFAAAPLVTQYAMDEPSATVPMEYDDATTESTPLYPVTNTAPCPVAQPPQNMIVNSEPQMMQEMNQYNYKPPRYLVLSLLTLIIFCFPLGLAALVCALKVDYEWNIGHYEDARRASRTAKLLSYAGITTGAAIIVGSCIMFVLLVLFTLNGNQ